MFPYERQITWSAASSERSCKVATEVFVSEARQRGPSLGLSLDPVGTGLMMRLEELGPSTEVGTLVTVDGSSLAASINGALARREMIGSGNMGIAKTNGVEQGERL